MNSEKVWLICFANLLFNKLHFVRVFRGKKQPPFIIAPFLESYGLEPVSLCTLFLENREISIKDIVKIIYHPRVMSRRKISFSYATFVVQLNKNDTDSFDVIHFPIYGLRKIKKHNKDIKLSCDKYIWFLILCPTVISAVLGFLLG